jgi:hypothetical protein
MRLLAVEIITCLLLATAAATTAAAQEQRNKTHVFLLDVSGSMEQDSRYANLKEWLIRPLLKSGAFIEGDRVIVRWFSEAKNEAANAPYDRRAVNNERYSEQVVLDNIPQPGQAKGLHTDIPRALKLTLEDIRGLNINGDVFIWLLTDNDQESGIDSSGEGRTNIKPLYTQITENKNFRAAYLFPLVNENGIQLGNEKSAMLLYLLHYSPSSSWPGLESLAGEVSKNINNPVITWFPFEKGVVPDLEPMSDEDVQFNGDTLILPLVPEGQAPSFNNIQFKLKSQLRSRSLSGHIKPSANVELTPPPSILIRTDEAQGGPPQTEADNEGKEENAERVKEIPANESADKTAAAAAGVIRLDVSLHPSNISLTPGQKSDQTYFVSLSSPVTLHPSSFWTAVWNSESEPINGNMQFQIENLRTDIETNDEALTRVKNHEFIKRMVEQSIVPNRPFSFDITFRVAYDSKSRRIILGLVALAAIVLCAGLLSLFFVKTRYELVTPGGDRILALPMIGKDYVSYNGHRAAVISKRFGRLTIKPLTNYMIDGTTNARPLSDNGEGFLIEDQQNGKRHSFSWKRIGRQSKIKAQSDDFFD